MSDIMNNNNLKIEVTLEQYQRLLEGYSQYFSLESGIKDIRFIQNFLDVLRLNGTIQVHQQNLSILLKSPKPVIDKFGKTRGLKMVVDSMRRAVGNYESNREFITLALDLLDQISVNKETILKSNVDRALDDIDEALKRVYANAPLDSGIGKKVYLLRTKWKVPLEEAAQEYAEGRAQKRVKENDTFDMGNSGGRSYANEYQDDEWRNGGSAGRPRLQMGKVEQKRAEPAPVPVQSPKDKQGNSNTMIGAVPQVPPRPGSKSRRNVRWMEDEVLMQIKYFRITDEPNAPGLTEAELAAIQKKLQEQGAMSEEMKKEDYKHKESRWEAESLKNKKEGIKILEHKLLEMIEKIEWTAPKAVKVAPKSARLEGDQSLEKSRHDQRIQSKLPQNYAKETQIPAQPGMDAVNQAADKRGSTPATGKPRAVAIPLVDQDGDKPEGDNGNGGIGALVQDKAKSGRIIREDRPVPKKGILKKKEDGEARKKLDNLLIEASTCNNEVRLGQILLEYAEQLKRMNPDEQNLKSLSHAIEQIKQRIEAQKKAAPVQRIATVQLVQTQMMSNPPQQPAVQAILTAPQIPTGPLQHSMGGQKLGMPSGGNQPIFNQSHGSGHLQIYQPNLAAQQNQGGKPSQVLMGQVTTQDPNKVQNRMQPVGAPVDLTKKPYPNKPANYKTVPCRLYHSPMGCERGDSCHFIHDKNYEGRETPNMQKYVRPLSKLSKNEEQNKKLLAKLAEHQKPNEPYGVPQNPSYVMYPGYGGAPDQMQRAAPPPGQYYPPPAPAPYSMYSQWAPPPQQPGYAAPPPKPAAK